MLIDNSYAMSSGVSGVTRSPIFCVIACHLIVGASVLHQMDDYY